METSFSAAWTRSWCWCALLGTLLSLVNIPCGAAVPATSDRLAALQLPEFSLSDYRGATVTRASLQDAKIVVLAFLGVECPLAKQYGVRLQALATTYAPHGVRVIGVNANSQDSLAEMANFAKAHGLEFPLLKDTGNHLADAVQAERTPEVFVYDQDRQLRYRGRVDDQYGIGYVRDQPSQYDLKQALDELLAGKPVTTSRTSAPGCLIGRVRRADETSHITYANTIHALLQKRCVECHRAGDIAPFALTDYDEVAGWAEMIGEVVAAGRMPPWHATPDGVALADDRRLTDVERQQVAAWVAAGAPAGDVASTALPQRSFPVGGWQLPGEPDVVIPMQKQPHTVPAEGAIRYQYFAAPTGITTDRWIQAVEVRPGNRAVVHHVLVFVRPQGSTDVELNGGGVDGFFAGYVPGLRAVAFPPGMAKFLPANSELIFQLHYTPIGREQQDLSEIGLIFADEAQVQYEVRTVSAYQPNLRIPPGVSAHEVVARMQLHQSAKLLGLNPHLHLRGKSFQYWWRSPQSDAWTSLLNVPQYDFNWQTNYRLAAPIDLPAGSLIKCVAQFDNSAANLNNPDPQQVVRWGEQTWDEMMIGYFDIAIAKAEADTTRNQRPDRAEQFILQFDDNDDQQLQITELPWAMRLSAFRADVDRNGIVSAEELKDHFGRRRAKHEP